MATGSSGERWRSRNPAKGRTTGVGRSQAGKKTGRGNAGRLQYVPK